MKTKIPNFIRFFILVLFNLSGIFLLFAMARDMNRIKLIQKKGISAKANLISCTFGSRSSFFIRFEFIYESKKYEVSHLLDKKDAKHCREKTEIDIQLLKDNPRIARAVFSLHFFWIHYTVLIIGFICILIGTFTFIFTRKKH